MKRVVKFVIAFIQDILGLIRPLVFQIQYQHFKSEIDYDNSKDAICILGNGPSLMKFKENNIKTDCCTVNFSGNTDLFFELKPKMYVLSDVAFYQELGRGDVKQLWDNIKKVNWDMTIFIPYTFPQWLKEMCEKNHFIKVLRYCQTTWEPTLPCFKRLKMKLYKMGLMAPRNQNVMIPSIYTAILSGYRRIYLYGVEHSWLVCTYVDKNNTLMQRDEHYYGTSVRPWLHADGRHMKMYEFLEMMYNTFRNYWYLRDFADSLKNVRIFNKTENSFIDAFERE